MSKNYNDTKLRPIGAKPTPEELKAQQEEQAKRAFYQKRNSLAEIILANAVQGTNKKDYKDAVDLFLYQRAGKKLISISFRDFADVESVLEEKLARYIKLS